MTKSILSKTPKSYVDPIATLNRNDFNSAIKEHGYRVYTETALTCPCKGRSSGHALVDCVNCFGSGWFFFNKKETVLMIQSINQVNSKFKEWNKALSGFGVATSISDQSLGYMDKITMFDHIMHHRQLVRLRKSNDGQNIYGYTELEPKEFRSVFLFDGASNPLRELRSGVDFDVDVNKITLKGNILDELPPERSDPYLNRFMDISLATVFSHHPVWHVMDASRSFSAAIKKRCDNGRYDQNELPLKYVIAQPQYLPESPKYDGTEREDNSQDIADKSSPATFNGTTTL